MATNAIRDAIALIAANPELFKSVKVDKDGNVDVSALESFAVRGDALLVIERKCEGISEEAREEFADTLFSLAADVLAVVKESGRSGQHRITVSTPSGKLSVVLEP